MTHADFWTLVDMSIAGSGDDPERQCALITDALMALPAWEIADYYDKFLYFSRLANDLAQTGRGALGAVYEEVGSDDSWIDWQAWLISRGQEIYFTALVASKFTDLAEVVDQSFEKFGAVAYSALEAKWKSEDKHFDYMDAQVPAHGLSSEPVALLALGHRQTQSRERKLSARVRKP